MAAVFADMVDSYSSPLFSNGGMGHHIHTASSLYEDQRALQLAVELSKLGFQDSTEPRSRTSSFSDDHGYSEQTMTEFGGGALHNMCQRKSQNTTECVPVPSSEHVAEIVGRQGCKIKALRAKTNTYIKTPVRGEEPVFVVTGRKEDVEAAKQEILSAADHFTQIRASRRHSQGGAPAPGHVTAYVRVPYKLVGLVVGPKGATIKRIQQQTHTYIITPSRDKEPIFEVTGLPDNVETARSEIELHIASRTGSFSPTFDGSSASPVDDFRMNGFDSAPYGSIGNAGNAYRGDATMFNESTFAQQQIQQSQMYRHAPDQQQQTQFGAKSAMNNLLKSQVQNGCGAWLQYAATHHGGEHDDGVWSMSGDSPTSLSVEPLIPSCLSSIWSDLEDPKDSILPRRSASISVPGGVDNSFNGSAFSSTQASWSSGCNEHRSAAASSPSPVAVRRFSSAPSTSGLYRQVVQNMLGASGGGGSQASSSSSSTCCHVCQSAPAQAALAPCGHRCFCFVCATRLCQMPKPVCPVCQASVGSCVRLA